MCVTGAGGLIYNSITCTSVWYIFTSSTFILTAPMMWSKHWLIDTPLPPLLVCIVTGTTLPRTDSWLCQKRARLDDVPALILVVGPLGTTSNSGVPGSLRLRWKKKVTWRHLNFKTPTYKPVSQHLNLHYIILLLQHSHLYLFLLHQGKNTKLNNFYFNFQVDLQL